MTAMKQDRQEKQGQGSDPEIIAILPAAGRAARLSPFAAPKEVLPVVYDVDPTGRHAQPILAIEYSLAAVHLAGIPRCFVILSEWKTELFRYLGNGSGHNLHLAYLHQVTPTGLARAVDLAFPWCRSSDVCLALPDTVYRPHTALADVIRELRSARADLVLGIFPHRTPEKLGPVRIQEGGRLDEVFDKPDSTALKNTWGVAAWSPKFTEFLHETVRSVDPSVDVPLGSIFNLAIQQGLQARGIMFDQGAYFDLGSPDSIADFLIRK
jgi:glucose-1-phosphate thymidylyltransferase